MTIIRELLSPENWESFYEYKLRNIEPKYLKDLRTFIDEQGYLPIVYGMLEGKPFPPPKKILVSKQSSQKKRVVYSYPPTENMVLKLLTHLLIRKYDGLFTPNLYSFRADHGVLPAIMAMTRYKGVRSAYTYKVDISDYFNSVDIEVLLPELETVLCTEACMTSDPTLCQFIRNLLENPRIFDKGQLVEDPNKGIMAGSPISVFLANFYLRELDEYFWQQGIRYARYSDDILVMAEREEDILLYREKILSFLAKRGLQVNSKKECFTRPHEAWTFLGIQFHEGEIDVAPVSVEKLKGKIRRKTRALKRRQDRRGKSRQEASPSLVSTANTSAAASQKFNTWAASRLVKTFNRKLLDNPEEHELTWTRWYFPLITTTKSLQVIDDYMQDQIRFLATGSRRKSRYNFRYEDMKELGYVSLVHEYYKFKERKKTL